MNKTYTIYLRMIVWGIIILFCVVKPLVFSSKTEKTTAQRIESAQQLFFKYKSDYVSIIKEIRKYKIEGYFHMQTRLNREDRYGIFDVDGNDWTLKVPYYDIHCDLKEKYGRSITGFWFMRGQLIFSGLGSSLLYTEIPYNEIKFVDSTNVEYCVYPNLPKQDKFWMCKIDENWYIIDSDLSGGIKTYERKVAKGLIVEDTGIDNINEDSLSSVDNK